MLSLVSDLVPSVLSRVGGTLLSPAYYSLQQLLSPKPKSPKKQRPSYWWQLEADNSILGGSEMI